MATEKECKRWVSSPNVENNDAYTWVTNELDKNQIELNLVFKFLSLNLMSLSDLFKLKYIFNSNLVCVKHKHV